MDFLPPEIEKYAEDHTSPESEVLAKLNRETHQKVLYPRMLSGHIQGRILAMLSKMLQPKRVLEIGTYTGYSSLCIAEGLAEGGSIITMDIDPELQEMAEKYWNEAGYGDQITFMVGNAGDLIPGIEGELDLVFIDADKQNYVKYFELVYPKLRKGGVILADNVLWSGRILDPDVHDKETNGIRAFNKFVKDFDGIEHVLLPVRDGIMMVRKI